LNNKNNERVEFSVSDGSKILRDTMRTLGYSRSMAELGVWSALWLEERHLSGITKLIVYLCLVNDMPFEDLKPKTDSKLGIKGICPFMLAEILIHFSDKWEPNGGIYCGAPAEANLAMASLADWAALRGKSLRLSHLNYRALYSAKGFELETDDLSLFGWINTDNTKDMQIELCEVQPSDGSCRKIQSINLPKKRLQGSGLLDLS